MEAFGDGGRISAVGGIRGIGGLKGETHRLSLGPAGNQHREGSRASASSTQGSANPKGPPACARCCPGAGIRPA